MLPNAGPLAVSGMTLTEFRAALKKELGKFYRNTEINCQLTVPRSFTVYVLGQVGRPGPVELYAPFRLSSAIASAGGVTETGTQRSIEIRSGDDATVVVDLQSFLRLGDRSGNPSLREGQSVFVPATGPSCAITGAVWGANVYEILPGESVADIIALAGGTKNTADLDRIVLERINKDEALEIIDVDAANMGTTWLQDRDVVVVPDYPSFVPRARVRIDAMSGRDGYVLLQDGETIGTLLRRIGRFEPQHELSMTVVERRDDKGKLEYINIDVESIINGDAPDTFELKSGDVVSIPRQVDVVFVMGDVVEPKGVPFQRGLPAARYIALAGGPNSDGSSDRLDIFTGTGCRSVRATAPASSTEAKRLW